MISDIHTHGSTSSLREQLEPVLQKFTRLGRVENAIPITMGLINKTVLIVTDVEKYIVQELSPQLSERIMYDSEMICDHLERAGIITPRIIPTDDGDIFFKHNHRIFRALKYIDGKSYHHIESPVMARSAGAVLGKFHHALLGVTHRYHVSPRHGGAYQFHVNNLQAALQTHHEHPFFTAVRSRAPQLIVHIMETTRGMHTRPRHVHGDPKISNILFDHQGQALCLVDFDTVRDTGWPLEIADALRSWCNPNQEDVLSAQFNLDIAQAALQGYGAIMGSHFTFEEAQQLRVHSSAIIACLAIRYLADTLNENYFAHDPTRYARAAEHNWARACAMYNLFLSCQEQQNELWQLIQKHLL